MEDKKEIEGYVDSQQAIDMMYDDQKWDDALEKYQEIQKEIKDSIED